MPGCGTGAGRRSRRPDDGKGGNSSSCAALSRIKAKKLGASDRRRSCARSTPAVARGFASVRGRSGGAGLVARCV